MKALHLLAATGLFTVCNGCPGLYPENTAFNFSRDFFVKKVNVTMRLSDIVNRDDYGPIEDLIEEQRKHYERFDGWSDFNDQALVAKTFDGICFMTFAATGSGSENPLGLVLSEFVIGIEKSLCRYQMLTRDLRFISPLVLHSCRSGRSLSLLSAKGEAGLSLH